MKYLVITICMMVLLTVGCSAGATQPDYAECDKQYLYYTYADEHPDATDTEIWAYVYETLEALCQT